MNQISRNAGDGIGVSKSLNNPNLNRKRDSQLFHNGSVLVQGNSNLNPYSGGTKHIPKKSMIHDERVLKVA